MKKRGRWSRRKSGPSKYNKQREGKMPSFAVEGERNLFFFWRVSALAHSPAQVRPLTDSFIITISADALRTRERNKIQRDAIQWRRDRLALFFFFSRFILIYCQTNSAIQSIPLMPSKSLAIVHSEQFPACNWKPTSQGSLSSTTILRWKLWYRNRFNVSKERY